MTDHDPEAPTKSDPTLADVHDTQNSLSVAAPASHTTATGATSEENDTLLSAPAPEHDLTAELTERLDDIEGQLTKLSARVRLLEKAEPASKNSLRWLMALLFFLLLAVSWQLSMGAR